MSPTYKTLTNIVAWVCFLSGLASVIAPIVLGIVTGNLAGSINDVESGKLWFYQHGLSFLIGAVFFTVYLASIKVRQSLD